jgi:hypothetical protein
MCIIVFFFFWQLNISCKYNHAIAYVVYLCSCIQCQMIFRVTNHCWNFIYTSILSASYCNFDLPPSFSYQTSCMHFALRCGSPLCSCVHCVHIKHEVRTLPTLEVIYIYYNDVLSFFIMCLCTTNNFVMQHFEVHNYDVFKI